MYIFSEIWNYDTSTNKQKMIKHQTYGISNNPQLLEIELSMTYLNHIICNEII